MLFDQIVTRTNFPFCAQIRVMRATLQLKCEVSATRANMSFYHALTSLNIPNGVASIKLFSLKNQVHMQK
jgi:hypothetical protein